MVGDKVYISIVYKNILPIFIGQMLACLHTMIRLSSFQDLLKQDNLVSIHHRNKQAENNTLIIKIEKKKFNIAPEILKELFAPKMSPYDLRNNNSLMRRRVIFVCHDNELVSYLVPKKQYLVSKEIKESESLNAFKFKIK